MSAKLSSVTPQMIFDSLNDGLYVCDKQRTILFWSKAAERITGWGADEVVGRSCHDNLLNHIDKDGHSLCGREFCPLHRSMETGRGSQTPVIVFGQTRDGGRVPMVVSVAPIHDEAGQIIGGVETFRDFSETYADMMRAKQIQRQAMSQRMPRDERVSFSSCYTPHDVIGGDFLTVKRLDNSRYAFFLADVMGHGVAAALYTMHLGSLWLRYAASVERPAEFARQVNLDLCLVVRDETFATGICGVLDLATGQVRIASAGGPSPVLFAADGGRKEIRAPGCPFGLIENAVYDEIEFPCAPGERLLMFTDGATEIHDKNGHMLGSEGLFALLAALGYPARDIPLEELQGELLRYSDEICLKDDLTLLDIHRL